MTGRAAHPLALGLIVALLGACGQYPGLRRAQERPEVVAARFVAVADTVPLGQLSGDGFTSGMSRGFDAGGSRGDGDRVKPPSPGVRLVKVGGYRVFVAGDGPIYTCPVYGRGYYTSSFGDFRAGPPVHPHQGNDVFAPYGTPIVAPFDGVAVATPNTLGGRAVTVYGSDGYVYNAHLSRYGRVGPVELGQVIGFVGDSGNARGGAPHDHFEWHPGGGPGVDPFPFLTEACPRDTGTG